MTPERIEQERAAFEAWWCETIGVPEQHREWFIKQQSPCLEKYQSTGGHTAWQAWLARAAQSEWISVEERLPEAHDDILVYTCDGDIYPILAICRDITWIGISGATHWQPLPEPPETRGK